MNKLRQLADGRNKSHRVHFDDDGVKNVCGIEAADEIHARQRVINAFGRGVKNLEVYKFVIGDLTAPLETCKDCGREDHGANSVSVLAGMCESCRRNKK